MRISLRGLIFCLLISTSALAAKNRSRVTCTNEEWAGFLPDQRVASALRELGKLRRAVNEGKAADRMAKLKEWFDFQNGVDRPLSFIEPSEFVNLSEQLAANYPSLSAQVIFSYGEWAAKHGSPQRQAQWLTLVRGAIERADGNLYDHAYGALQPFIREKRFDPTQPAHWGLIEMLGRTLDAIDREQINHFAVVAALVLRTTPAPESYRDKAAAAVGRAEASVNELGRKLLSRDSRELTRALINLSEPEYVEFHQWRPNLVANLQTAQKNFAGKPEEVAVVSALGKVFQASPEGSQRAALETLLLEIAVAESSYPLARKNAEELIK